jgi:hypothetical protein
MKKALLILFAMLLIPSLTSANTGTNKWALRKQAIAIQKAIKACPIQIPKIATTVAQMTGEDNAKQKYLS